MEQKIMERNVRERIIADMMGLLERRPEEGLRWCLSKTDLMEMVHIVYCTDLVRDKSGLPVTFRELVGRVCAIVHVSVPANPNQLVARARMRKGRKVLPLMKRYDGLSLGSATQEKNCDRK